MHSKIKIIVDDKIPFIKGILEPYADVVYLPGTEINNKACIYAEALIIRTRTKCNADLLDGTSVKLIATATIGYDHIDTEYCARNNIIWKNAPGCNSGSVMQYLASALSFLANKYNFELSSKTIGIVGVGNVGSKVAKVAETFGMNVLLNDPPRKRDENSEHFVELEELIEKSDIITFHTPLNMSGKDKTYHLCNNEFLSRVKKDVIIINTSRGEVIETNALKNALKNGEIKGAILDVWENEPNIDLELLRLVDIATPHIAGYSADGKANGTSKAIKVVADYFGFNIPNNWYPQKIPCSEQSQQLIIDCTAIAKEDILKDIILHTYNIKDDSNKLKSVPVSFENLRGNYQIRREFNYYSVELLNLFDNEIISALKCLGVII